MEPASVWTAGRSPEEADTDFPIQGTVHASLTMNTTGKAGILVPGETGWASGDYIFGWLIWLAPAAIAVQASGGLVMIIGDSASVWRVFYVGGSDYGSYPYGGWQNFVVNPEGTPDENAGTPTTFSYVGAGANVLSQVSKGNPLGFDVFRYGRGEARVAGGTSTDPDATFAGLAAVNDNNSNRWGLFQEIEGGYKCKGKLVIGFGAACDFTDSDVNIVIDNTEFVAADFNRIEITNAASVINWTNINFTALGTTSKGQLEMIDDATFNDTGGVFTDMDTFIYDSNATITGRTFRRCGQVTQNAGTFTGSVFEDSTAAVALVVDSLNDVTECYFDSDGTGHAVNLGTFTADTSRTWDNTESGYAIQTGTAANRTILVNIDSPYTLTLNKTSTSSHPTYYNTGTGTVLVVASSSIYIRVQDQAKANIVTAYVYINDDDAGTAEVNDTTDANGEVTDTYSGSITTATLRVRKYGYKPFIDTVDLSADITRTITLVTDPQQT